jgi:hypothetical protein
VFKHPKYYEELRKRAKEEEAASCKPQAPKDSSRKRQAASPEQQAASDKPQAASSKTSLPS